VIKALILDLDDTIFPTSSIDSKVVKPFFDTLEKFNDVLTEEELNKAKQEIHKKPFATVASDYKFSERMITESLDILNNLEYKLSIKTYDDYAYIKALSYEKFLVTTGNRKFQLAKIESLQIADDFKEIFIDDPIERPGGKLIIFRSILEKYSYLPDEILVIGDNPESEISAGKELGTYVLMINRNKRDTLLNKEVIQSFTEVNERIKKLILTTKT